MYKNGSKWIRADFHLHTKSDKEFKYDNTEDRFISDYVEKLKEEDIKLAVITNHNKFNYGEFKALKKKAKRKDITILPGVELTVKEGANGIHCLVVFKEEDWIVNGNEKINQFLDESFKGIDNRENKNTRSVNDLIKTIRCLDTYNSDYFIIMAHIEQKSGFFFECKGGLIESLSSDEKFKKSVLGFQKGRCRESMKKLEGWMKYKLPYVEGSDCKSIQEIGKGERCYIKIGSNDFDSVKLAFLDFNNRISLEHNEYRHSYIKSINFKGGKMNDKKIYLSPELNTLIGIRGSGKSTLIELIRYALDIEPSDSDKDYKEQLVDEFLGSGGQIIMEIQDLHGKSFTIKRTNNEETRVFSNNNNKEIDLNIGALLHNPLYFGQKDLSNTERGFELKLLNKFIGNKSKRIIEEIIEIENELKNKFRYLYQLKENILDLKTLEQELTTIRYKIEIFDKNGISDKLKEQTQLQAEKRIMNDLIIQLDKFIQGIEKYLNSEDFNEILYIRDKNLESYMIKNQDIKNIVDKIEKTRNILDDNVKEFTSQKNNLNELLKEINEIQKTSEEEFAKIRREINVNNVDDIDDFKKNNINNNLDPDEYTKLKNQESDLKKKIREVKKEKENREYIENHIKKLIEKREEKLINEFKIYEEEIKKINSRQSNLNVSINYKGDKVSFKNQLKEKFKGSHIDDTRYEKLSENYTELLEIIEQIIFGNTEKLLEILTDNQISNINKITQEKYEELISSKVNNKIDIKYHDKNIDKHSIGQRASAILTFILSQEDNHVILVDQPEDDLDNQVIYQEIIKKIKERKPEVQFIFATHNANIPVLGDSEQVFAVSYDEKELEIFTGSIDNKEIQNSIIKIMEGGKEAFDKRNKIYSNWKN